MPRRFQVWLGLVLLIAAGVRLPHFMLARSLWLDEAMLALNIAARGFADLLEPLDFNQAAPIGFLMLERVAVALAGFSEQSLRALPLLAGLATVPLVGLAGRRLSGDVAGILAATLAALSPTLVRYSNEVKPYSLDACAAVAILLLTLRAIDGSPRARAWLTAGGTLGLLVSFPAVFSAGTALVSLAMLPSGRRPRWTFFARSSVVWGLAVAVPYVFIYSGVAGSAAQQLGYSYALLTPGPDFGARAWLAARGTLLPPFAGDGSGIPVAPTLAVVGLGLALALGAAQVARERGAAGVTLLLGPFALALAFSALRRYPLGVPRLMQFGVPLLLLLAAAALALVGRRLTPGLGSRGAFALLAGAALFAPAQASWTALRSPYVGEEAEKLLDTWRALRRGTQEPVYVGARGLASWLFYTTNWDEFAAGHQGFAKRLAFYARAASGLGPSFENHPPRGRAVANEGDDLVYEFRGRRELLGLFTGRHWSWPAYASPEPDPGWAANEARRVHAEAVRNPDHPCAWLYFTRMSERSFKPLTWELRDTYGAQRDVVFSARGGALWRMCFPGTPQSRRAPVTDDTDTDG